MIQQNRSKKPEERSQKKEARSKKHRLGFWLLASGFWLLASPARANQAYNGSCVAPSTVTTAAVTSSTKAQVGYPGCTVTVYYHGTTNPATIYSDNNNTPLASTFTAQNGVNFFFYAAQGRYDYQMSGGSNGGFPSPVSVSDVVLFDPAQLATSYQAVSFSSTPSFNAQYNSAFSIALTGNVTSSSVTNAVSGQQLIFNICQDATGYRTFSWPPNFLSPPVVSPIASSCTNAAFLYDGTHFNYIGVGSAVGYSPTAGSGLTLNLSPGTASCGMAGPSAYAGGTLTLTASATNYVFIASGCVPAFNTSGFGSYIPIATVTTSGSAITSIVDQRTQFQKASNVFNVVDFGATGNGSTDDSTAISAAITAACVNGGVVLFPAGKFYTTVQFTGCSNLTIMGQGPTASTVSGKTGNPNQFMFLWSGTFNNVTVTGLEINGNQTGTTGQGGCIAIGKVNGFWGYNNFIHDCGNSSFDVDPNGTTAGSSNVFIYDNVLGPTHSNVNSNIQLGNGLAKDIVIHNNTITNTLSGVIQVDMNGVTNVTFSGNHVSGTGFCVQLETGSGTTQNVAVTGNYLSCANAGVWVGTGAATSNKNQNNVISGNTIIGCGTGIAVDSFNGGSSAPITNISMTGNIIQNSGGAGVYFNNSAGSTWAGIVFAANVINGYGATCSAGAANAGIAICTAGAQGVTIQNNTVRGTSYGFQDAYAGVHVGAVILKGNNFTSNSSGDIAGNGGSRPDTNDIHFAFTPNTSSYVSTYGTPFVPAAIRLNLTCNVASGGNYTYLNWTGIVYFAGNAFINAAVVQLASINQNNGIGATIAVAGSTGNAITITVTNASGTPVYGTITVLGYDASPTQ